MISADEFCSVSFETSHEGSCRPVSNVSIRYSGGVREREKETKDGCAVRERGRGGKDCKRYKDLEDKLRKILLVFAIGIYLFPELDSQPVRLVDTCTSCMWYQVDGTSLSLALGRCLNNCKPRNQPHPLLDVLLFKRGWGWFMRKQLESRDTPPDSALCVWPSIA